MKTVLAVGDLHAPWHCRRTLSRIHEIAKKEKPDIVIQMGDPLDCFSQGRFPRPNIITPSEELTRGRMALEQMWARFQKDLPKAKCFQLYGNHMTRPRRLLIEKCPELEPFFDDKAAVTFTGVETIYDSRQELEIEGVLYVHGFLSKLGDHVRYFGKSVVHGHTHKAGIVYHNVHGDGRPKFEFDVGYCGQDRAVCFAYTPSRFTQWVRGCGIIQNGVPRFLAI